MIKNIELYILIFFIYAFAGWCLESIGGIFNPKVKKFINRGFLIGPYCPVYGIGVVLVSILLKKYTNDIPALFFLSLLICGVLEYFTGYIMEKFFNARWWDYSSKKFNINGRVCLDTLLPFGIVAVLIINKINPLMLEGLNKLSNITLHIISVILSITFIIDFIISFKIILSFKDEIRDSKDNTEEIVNKVKDITEGVGEIILDKAENKWMKTESDIRYYSRKYKLKLLRKARFTRNRITEKVPRNINEIAQKMAKSREEIEERIMITKNKIDEELKLKISKHELKQKERILETKQIIDNFKNKSGLKTRLMNAFPNLEIKKKNKD